MKFLTIAIAAIAAFAVAGKADADAPVADIVLPDAALPNDTIGGQLRGAIATADAVAPPPEIEVADDGEQCAPDQPSCSVLDYCSGCLFPTCDPTGEPYFCLTQDDVNLMFEDDSKGYDNATAYMEGECPTYHGSICASNHLKHHEDAQQGLRNAEDAELSGDCYGWFLIPEGYERLSEVEPDRPSTETTGVCRTDLLRVNGDGWSMDTIPRKTMTSVDRKSGTIDWYCNMDKHSVVLPETTKLAGTGTHTFYLPWSPNPVTISVQLYTYYVYWKDEYINGEKVGGSVCWFV